MKKENFTLDKNAGKRIARLSIIPVLLMLFVFQANAQCPLGCNNSVQVSLDNDCEVVVTPDMILEGQGGDMCDYMVEVLDANDNPIPGSPVVDGSYIGQTLKARVSLGANSCWGFITIEDKLRPTIDCGADVEITCYESFNPGLPAASDNCDPNPIVKILSDVTEDLDCNDQFSAIRTIIYQAEDASGNLSETCTRTITYTRIGLADITFPQNLDDVELPSLSCDDFSSFDEDTPGYPFFDVTGAPSTPNGAPILPNNSLCELNATFSDEILTICESSFKVLRTFTVLDWCTGEVAEDFQIIKIVDNEGPIVSTIADDEFAAFADPYTCLGEFDVPDPVVLFDCSSTSYTVAYAVADDNGDPPTDGIYYTDNVITNPDGSYTIVDLPLGMSWLRYTITDACGNSTEAFTEVTVVDNIPPIAVCDEFTVVTLTNDGSAYIFAESFDDGSFDNCNDVTVLARRITPGCGTSTTQFTEFVEFCCADVGNDIMVEMQVREDRPNGLTNSCMVTVRVQDKIDPVIICPPTANIDCEQDYTDLSITGSPEGFDNCGSFTISPPSDIVNLDQCGVGTVIRSWTITDAGGRTDNCSQIINVTNGNLFNGNNPNMLQWPADVDLEGCMNDNTDESETGVPIINASSCSLVAYSSSDKVFNFQDGACFKILRTFTVIDWCQYDPDDNSTTPAGIWQYTQVIKLNNSIAPEFVSCSNYSACIFGEDCRGFVEITQSATDDCPNVDESELSFSWQLDEDNDGDIDDSGLGNDASQVLGIGIHRIIWSVEDGCGNLSTCSQLITVEDCKKPTPYCLSDITTVVMPTSGMIQIWASDFDLGSTDNCPGDLTFTFVNGSGSMTFDCDDEGMNTIQIYVTDANGNSDFCETTINIQANEGCEGSRIAGTVMTEVSGQVEQVEVMLEDMDSHEERYFMTDASGHYQFVNIAANIDYEVSATRNDDHANGVSTLDLVLIQRHILGFADLDSPYKIIAADVNNSEHLSVADVSELRKLILGVRSEFSNNTSWRFVDGAQQFAEPNNPWPFNEKIDIENFTDSDMDNDFVAVKIGDVNLSASTGLQSEGETEVRSGNMMLHTVQQDFTAGDLVEVPFYSADFKSIVGLQYTMSYDASVLEYESVESGSIIMTNDNVGLSYADRGEITTSWSNINSVTTDEDQVLFTVTFRAKADGDLSKLSVNSDQVQAESYTTDLSIAKVALDVRSTLDIGEMTLAQNRPNPFSNHTSIAFTLPQSGLATLSIYDINGRVIFNQAGTYEKGEYSIEVDAEDLGMSGGIYYYKLESNGQIATKKMILLSK